MPARKKTTTRRAMTLPNPTANLEFQIQQLRLDKLVYSMEALLVGFTVFLLLVSLPIIYTFVPTLPPYLPLVLVGIAVAAAAYALVTNMLRLKKVRQLEAQVGEK